MNIVTPDAETVAPVDGVIAAWSIKGTTAGAGYQLYTLSRSGTSYTANTESTIERPTSGGLQFYLTDQPIKKGEYVGVGISEGATIGFNKPAGSEAGIAPLFQAGGSGTMESGPGEFAFNAELSPAPTITGFSPSGGPVAGGTVVRISGSDLGNASAVKFGTAPATSFSVDSDSEITAVAPSSPTADTVPISVTTILGTGTSAQLFSYESPLVDNTPALHGTPGSSPGRCIVPKLRGEKLKTARKALAKAHCKLGKVKGKRDKSAKVKSQHPKAGATPAPGSKVAVKLG